MADAEAFAELAAQLETETNLDRLEARGTLRIALKAAGFDAKSVQADELRVVVEKVLPKELELRGIAASERLCQKLARSIHLGPTAPGDADSPEAIFDRLVGGS